MGLPYVVEYLLAQQRPGGSYLVRQGGNQVLIPIVPPYTEVILQVFPGGGDYAELVYETYFSSEMVPGAFFAWAQHFGAKSSEGVLTGGVLANPLNGFVFVSAAQPALALIRNITPLNQFYCGHAFSLTIASEEDYKRVLETLDRLATSVKAERLAQEAVNLLRVLTGGALAPQPPIGGS